MASKWMIGLGIFAVVLGAGAYIKRDFIAFALHAPKDRDVLQWTVAQRDYAFRHLNDLPMVKAHALSPTTQPIAFTPGPALQILAADEKTPFDIDQFMADQRGVGTLVIVDGKIRLEKYGMNYTANDTWTSFSVAKSFTSTLLGAAIKDGYIKSIDEPVTDIIPEFKGSAYDGVTLQQILTMTSGVQWNENYADPHSDVGKMGSFKSEAGGEESVVTQLKSLPRAAPPGTRWHYSTAETGLIGVIVMRATHKPLATYLTEKIWQHRMAQPGFWVVDLSGREIGGCCISAALADYARFGQFMMDGAKVNGNSILPDGWIAAATSKRQETGEAGRGYGYQWWTYDDGSFSANGHFGQGIFIDPRRHIVIATNADYPTNREHARFERKLAFYRLVQQAVDREQGVRGRVLMQ
jgi:CubicO group peptidase (beta-lactamase class C family)